MDNFRSEDINSELYFLIYKCLQNGPFQKTVKNFIDELQSVGGLSYRLDWTGVKHPRTVDDLQQTCAFAKNDYLYQLCCRAGVLNKSTPNKVVTLFSLNKRYEKDYNFRQLCDFVVRHHLLPIRNKKLPCNLANILRGREISGPLSKQCITYPNLYSQLQFQRRTLGHLSAVYCILFDHTGNYLITGADDLLIKLWSLKSGRLINTFRGASSEITDIAINIHNTLLAAGSVDRILRVWSLQTGTPIAVLTGHTGMITSVNFCPSSSWDLRYLVTTSTDGSVAFWGYTTNMNDKVEFRMKPTLYQEKMRPGQAQMICSSFSPGGAFLATGSADHHVRVYYMKSDEGPHRILEVEAHDDRVDSIQWAHSGLRFLSGSKDGSAIIWTFERQQWKSVYLRMTTKLVDDKDIIEDPKKLKVTMVAWDYSDSWVATAVSDYTLKVWDVRQGRLDKVLTGHTDEVYVLEPHPYSENIILSAGHDGQLFIWDIQKGAIIFRFLNTIEGQGYGALFDVKWSPDATSIGISDSHGHLIILGFGRDNPLYEQLPKELFFHTDYRPLVRDSNNHVLDEQTQIQPHLMPPPFLVDIDGNPYPPMLQRLVPGREHCNTEQLVPSVILGTEGTQEVIQVVPEDANRVLNMHEMNSGNPEGSNNFIASRSTPRRLRDVEGIRQCSGEWQRDPNSMKWKKHVLVPPLTYPEVKVIKNRIDFYEEREIDEYHKQLCQRPQMINTTPVVNTPKSTEKKKRQPSGAKRRLTTHYCTYVICPSDETSLADSDISESTGYSDWVAEENVNVDHPTTRTRRRKVNYNTDSDQQQTEQKEDDPSQQKPCSTSKLKANTKASRHKVVPDVYRTSEWLTEVKPRKTPYFPQIGDELVYFLQGHQLYLDTVQFRKIYEVNNKILPWVKFELQNHEFVKVVDIEYEIKPPRLCCLKLALLDYTGKLTGKIFTVKYHDMPDVLDFFILKQYFDTAVSRIWNTGTKFRCLIDDGWWIGEVVSNTLLGGETNSYFLCYEIKWDNGEVEKMSPWDMEPIPDNLTENYKSNGEALPLLDDDLKNTLYQPVEGDWPNGNRDMSCNCIVSGISKVMELAIAEPFLVPVDLSVYPTYAFIVEYPIDLSTIKSRLENGFYRRITAIQFDIRYLAINAEKFNERHSVIVKHAKILTELCLRVIKQCTTQVDVNALYHQLVDTYDSSDSEVDVEVVPSSSRMLRSLPNRYLQHARDWKMQAESLLDGMWNCEDSVPFRAPVNSSKYPDYAQIIKEPMDLSTVKEKLATNQYDTPNDFQDDVRLIFTNSRTYNTNKRSRIYVMTVRMAAIFEEHMNKIIQNWKMAKRRSHTRRSNSENEEDDVTSQMSNCTSKQNSNETSEPESSSASSNKDSKKENEKSVLSSAGRSTNSPPQSPRMSDHHSVDNSEDNFGRRSLRPRQKKRLRRLPSSSDNLDSNSDSDNKPLITVVRARKRRALRNSSSSNKVKDDTSSISSSEEATTDNDTDFDSSQPSTPFTSVSSRGRLRKLTPRARALMRS